MQVKITIDLKNNLTNQNDWLGISVDQNEKVEDKLISGMHRINVNELLLVNEDGEMSIQINGEKYLLENKNQIDMPDCSVIVEKTTTLTTQGVDYLPNKEVISSSSRGDEYRPMYFSALNERSISLACHPGARVGEGEPEQFHTKTSEKNSSMLLMGYNPSFKRGVDEYRTVTKPSLRLENILNLLANDSLDVFEKQSVKDASITPVSTLNKKGKRIKNFFQRFRTRKIIHD